MIDLLLGGFIFCAPGKPPMRELLSLCEDTRAW
jgi:hypothetical protein